MVTDLPDNLGDALALPWCPERNLALRRLLGVERGLMNQAGVLILECPSERDVVRVQELLSPHVKTRSYQRPDGKWVVHSG